MLSLTGSPAHLRDKLRLLRQQHCLVLRLQQCDAPVLRGRVGARVRLRAQRGGLGGQLRLLIAQREARRVVLQCVALGADRGNVDGQLVALRDRGLVRKVERFVLRGGERGARREEERGGSGGG